MIRLDALCEALAQRPPILDAWEPVDREPMSSVIFIRTKSYSQVHGQRFWIDIAISKVLIEDAIVPIDEMADWVVEMVKTEERAGPDA